MRAEVKDQAEESLSASVVAGGRGRKGGSFQSAGAEEAVIGAEGAGTPPPPHTTYAAELLDHTALPRQPWRGWTAGPEAGTDISTSLKMSTF